MSPSEQEPSERGRSGAERREAVRVDIPLEAIYSCDCPPIHARIQDLSETGAFVDTHHPLAVGAAIDLQFELPEESEPVRVRGRVAWSAPMMGSGIEFEELESEVRERIKFYVAQVYFS